MQTNEKIKGYALAIFSIAKDEKKINLFLEQILAIKEAIYMNKDLIKILNSFSLENLDKENIVKTVFKDCDPMLINSLIIIAQKRLFGHIDLILNKFIKLAHENLNIKTGIIYSSKKLSPEKIKAIEEKLFAKYKKKIFLTNYIDNELILGLKIVIDNEIIEYSVKSQLRDIKKQLEGDN